MSPRLLGRIVRAECRGRRALGMALVVAIVAIATAGIVAGLQARQRAAASWDAAFAAANGAHVVVAADDAAILADVGRDPRVAGATHAYRVLTDVQIEDDGALVREVAADDLPAIGRPLVRTGRWATSRDEIVLERSYALARGLHVGDAVFVSHAGRRIPFAVVGTAVDLVDCFFPQCDPTPAWVLAGGFARLGGDAASDLETVTFLRLHDPEAADSFAAELDARPEELGVNTWTDTRADALVVVGFLGAFLAGMGFFLVVASAVVIASTMAGRVLARRRDIEILSVVGCTPRQVTTALVVTHVVAAGAGIVLGWVAGSALTGPVQLAIGRALSATAPHYRLRDLLVAGVVVEAIVLVATGVPAWRVRVRPTRGSRDRRRGTHLGPVMDRGVRESAAPLGRVVMVMLALTLAVLAMVATAGVRHSVDRAIAEPALTGDPSDLTIVGVDSNAPAIQDRTDVGAAWTVSESKGVVGDASFLVRALDGDVARAGYVVREGRMFRAPGEAVGGYGLMRARGVHVGDTIAVQIAGTTVRLRLVGWYAESEDSGEVLQMPVASLPVAVRDVPAVTKVRLFSTKDRHTVARELAEDTDARVVVNDEPVSDDLDAFNLAFTIVTALVVVVALANLGATLLLQARERAGQTAVARAIGFRSVDVIRSTMIATGIHTIIAIAIGVPLGLAGAAAMIDGVATDTGIGPGLGADPTRAAVAVASLGLLATTLGVAALVAWRSTRRSISSLVRAS